MDFTQMMFIILIRLDTVSLYIENKHWDNLDRAGLVGTKLQRKNNFKDGGIFSGHFLVIKIKYCLTKNKHGIIDEHKTLKDLQK